MTLHGLGVLLVLLAAPAGFAQDTTGVRLPDRLPSGPTYPLLFDDFAYPVPVGYDVGRQAGPAGSLFGANGWWTGPPGDTLAVTESRAWYAGHWHEGPARWPTWWSDGPFTINTTGSLGELVLRAEGTLTRGDGRGVDVRSGFSARTGTWIARVRLPDFDGLRHHGPVDPTPPFSMFPAFWTHSETAVEDREAYGYRGATWFEWNFEINNWVDAAWPYGRPPCGSPGLRPGQACARTEGGGVRTGLLWATGGLLGHPTRWARYNRDGNPTPGETAPGTCFVRTETRSGVREPAYCFDVLTGTAFADVRGLPPTYAYLMTVVTPETTRQMLLVRDEDAEGHPADLRPGFELLLMETPPFVNYVTPIPMQALFSLSFGWAGSDLQAAPLPEAKELGVDWLLYTPVTDRPVVLAAADGVAIRDWLRALPEAAPRRVNTVPWNADGPFEPLPLASRYGPFDDPCGASDRSAPALPFDFAVEVWHTEGRPYFLAVPVHDRDTGLRHTDAYLRWEVTAHLPSGDRRMLPVVEGEGWVLIGEDDAWRRADALDLVVTIQQRLPVQVEPGRWERRLLDPSCYGPDAGAMHTQVHRYRYVPTTGTLVPLGEGP